VRVRWKSALEGDFDHIAESLRELVHYLSDGATQFIDFDSEAALKNYLAHPIHKAVEAQMPSMLSEFLVSNYLY
jgi:hypothetical protein